MYVHTYYLCKMQCIYVHVICNKCNSAHRELASLLFISGISSHHFLICDINIQNTILVKLQDINKFSLILQLIYCISMIFFKFFNVTISCFIVAFVTLGLSSLSILLLKYAVLRLIAKFIASNMFTLNSSLLASKSLCTKNPHKLGVTG